MATLKAQFDDLVEQINRWDDRHRGLIERQRVAGLDYVANPRGKAVLAEKRAVAALIGPYQLHRNALVAQARALEDAIAWSASRPPRLPHRLRSYAQRTRPATWPRSTSCSTMRPAPQRCSRLAATRARSAVTPSRSPAHGAVRQ
jgi:hypothetical protein